MNWKRLARQAQRVIDKRGGPENLKEDAEELRAIAEEKGTMGEKLKEAAEAIREPGAPAQHHPAEPPGPSEQPGGQAG